MKWFALASYAHASGARTALVLGERVLDLAGAFSAVHPGAAVPGEWASLGKILADWERHGAALAALAEAADAQPLEALDRAHTRLLAPFVPPRIFGAASNYIEHAAEMETKLAAKSDSSPFVFIKASTSVIGPGDTVCIPPETQKADWEVELGVVIGRGGRRIRAQDALAHIAGYTIVNDVSARDMTRRSDYPFKHDWFRGKSFDTFCPLGPWFVPRACIADPHRLRLGLDLNGVPMQDGNTGEMIFDAFEQIAYISSLLTLLPGDVIATGTPAGVGMGRDLYLKPGDEMRAWIENIGELCNPVAAEVLA